MSIAVILAVLNGEDEDSMALEAALAVAQRADAHIRALHLRADPTDILIGSLEGLALSPKMVEIAESEIAEQAMKARRSFDDWRAKRDIAVSASSPDRGSVSAEWVEVTGGIETRLAEHARLADLVVVSPSLRRGSGRALASFETILFETRRPILIAPKDLPRNLFAIPVIAWKQTREAAQAVATALPLLGFADNVAILAASERELPAAVTDPLVTYLARHRITASAHRVDPSNRGIGEALLAEVTRQRASLLVLGGYGHSRLREMVFGGVTRHMLEHADVPVLMAH
jgi:nucleotide-binding universal stress UspA family protein